MSSHATKKRQSTAPVQAQMDTLPGRTMAPPTFQFRTEQEAMSSTSAPIQRTGNPPVLKEQKDQVEFGAAETGPLAVKGAGDAHEFSPNDVNQGALGDCYFLAALMTLAHTKPELLKNAVTAKDDGTYDVKLYKRKGLFKNKLEAQTINVNTQFVVYKGTSINAYAQGGDRDPATFDQEMWPRLIEKAYAQMRGSYDSIDGGLESVALEALTGEKYELKNFNGGFLGIGKMSDADLKSSIQGYVDGGEPISCATTSQEKIDKADKDAGGTFAKDNSIIGRHAYAIMAADDTHVTVRNPHGSGTLTPVVKLTWAQFRTYFERFSRKS